MQEYTEIVNSNIYTQNGKYYCKETVFDDLRTFWLCEYQNLADKLDKSNDELRTYHFCKSTNDVQKVVERSALFADRIIIPDITPLMGVGLTQGNYQQSLEMSIRFLSVISELTDWINEGIVVIIPSRFFGSANYSMDIKQNDSFLEYINPKDFFIKNIEKFPVQDMLFSSGSYNAIPSTNHPIIWNHLTEIILEEEKKLGGDIINIAAINSLNLNFLNDVPFDLVKKYRDKGYLAELRQYMKNKFKSITTYPNDSDFQYKIKDISVDINDEIIAHEHEWNDIRQDLRKGFTMTATGGVVAGLISAIITAGTPGSSLLGVVGGSIPITSGVNDFKNYFKEKRKLKRNGIHLLFDIKNNNQT